MRWWLLALKHLGLVAFLGGLLSLSALWRFGPEPTTIESWHHHQATVRVIFFSTVFAGVVVVVFSGLALLAIRRGAVLRRRWFRLKLLLAVVALPTLHFWARGRVLRLNDAVEAGRIEEAAALWDHVGRAFAIAFVVMLLIAGIGWVKPKLGETTTDEPA